MRATSTLSLVTTPGASDRVATRIVWGMAVGLVAGILLRTLFERVPGAEALFGVLPESAHVSGWLTTEVLDPFGQIFLRVLFFVVAPLVFGSLALGVVQLGRLDRLGPMAARTFALFGINMAVGVALGLVMMNLLQPGRGLDSEARSRLVAQAQATAQARDLQAHAEKEPVRVTFATLVEMFMPRNLLQAVVGSERGRLGDVLPLILFALLLGAAGTTLAEGQRRQLQEALEVLNNLMLTIVQFALRLAPYAVAALLMSIVIKMGLGFLNQLLLFVVGVLGVMALHLFGTMSLLLKLGSRRSPLQFFKAITTVMVTAFATSSSNATLPTTIQVSREKLGVSAPTAGFVLPLGATMNMSGTATYEGCVILFIAQVYGIPITLGQQVTLLALAVLSAVAVAGIPGASLPLIMGLLGTFGVPPEGIVLILGVDRVLDMARTVLNVAADMVTAVIVDEHMAAENPAPGGGAPT